jgi:hypothetical protein
LYYSLYFNKPFIGGFFNANQPVQWQNSFPRMTGFPDANSLEMLQKLKVKYIVVEEAAYPDYPAAKAEMLKLGLVELTEQDGEDVFTFSK